MGQYHKLVNLDKREFINPHKLGMGLKLWEQCWDMQAKIVTPLLAVSNGRGGGDFFGPGRYDTPEPPTRHDELIAEVVGRWGGDRIAMIGDYAEPDDLGEGIRADALYSLCSDSTLSEEEFEDDRTFFNEVGISSYAEYEAQKATDISALVAEFICYQFDGLFIGSGWRSFISKGKVEMWNPRYRDNPSFEPERLTGEVTEAHPERGFTIKWDHEDEPQHWEPGSTETVPHLFQ